MSNTTNQNTHTQSSQLNRTWSNFFSGIIWFVVCFVIIVAFSLAGAIVLGIIEAQQTGVTPNETAMLGLLQDGDLIGISYPPTMVAVIATLLLVIKFRRKRTAAEFLALNPQSFASLLKWLGLTGILLIVSVISGMVFDRPEVNEWMVTTFNTVDYKYLFAFALIVCAPILEETLFRGYILGVWLESKLHPWVAILLTSILWSAIHLQYDLYDMTFIFALGVLLGYARVKSNSLFPAIVIHAAWNLLAFAVTQYHLSA